NDEEQVIPEFQHDSLTNAAHARDATAVDGVDGRVDGSEDERTEKIQAVETLTDDVALQCLDVHHNVWKFGHIADSISHQGHQGQCPWWRIGARLRVLRRLRVAG